MCQITSVTKRTNSVVSDRSRLNTSSLRVGITNIFQDFTMAHYPKRILIVEDNKLDVRLLKDILEWR